MKSRSSFHPIIYAMLFSLLVLIFTNSLKAQINNEDNRQKGNFTSKLFFGGGFGLQFGSVTLIELSPLVGYKVTPKFSLGVSPTYKYYKYNDYYGPTNDLSTNVWGGSIFARYSIFQNVFAHVEYESLYYNTKVPGNIDYLEQYNSFFVGGGYNQQIGGNSAMYFLLLWNLNDTPDSPYINPVIRIGFSVGL
jgi:hypothetical protein